MIFFCRVVFAKDIHKKYFRLRNIYEEFNIELHESKM